MTALGVICIPTAQPLSSANHLIHNIHICNICCQLGQQADCRPGQRKQHFHFTPHWLICYVPHHCASGRWQCWQPLLLSLRSTQVIILIVLRKHMKSSMAYLERYDLIVSCSISALRAWLPGVLILKCRQKESGSGEGAHPKLPRHWWVWRNIAWGLWSYMP